MPHSIVPVRIYLLVFAALMALTAVTVAVAHADLGPLNTLIAIAIAGLKALLVILYFMHARYGGRLIWVVAGAGFLWLAILIVFTVADFAARRAVV